MSSQFEIINIVKSRLPVHNRYSTALFSSVLINYLYWITSRISFKIDSHSINIHTLNYRNSPDESRIHELHFAFFLSDM